MLNLEIYPEIWDRDPSEDDTLGYCLEYFEKLKHFIAAARSNNYGIGIFIG